MNSRVRDRAEHTRNWNSRKGAAPQRLGSREIGDEILKDGYAMDGGRVQKAFQLAPPRNFKAATGKEWEWECSWSGKKM